MSTTPGLAETIAHDWQKAERFYARFGVTEGQLRAGVPAVSLEDAAHALNPEAGAADC